MEYIKGDLAVRAACQVPFYVYINTSYRSRNPLSWSPDIGRA